MSNMFSFFDNQQNPFINMMNMMNGNDRTPGEDAAMPMAAFMQQAFKMQMQFMQSMCMMPLCMMQTMSTMLGKFPGDAAPEKAATGQAGGFKIGDMEIPPEILGTLLSMDMSPENLEKLQKLLDFVFELMPQSKKATETEE